MLASVDARPAEALELPARGHGCEDGAVAEHGCGQERHAARRRVWAKLQRQNGCQHSHETVPIAAAAKPAIGTGRVGRAEPGPPRSSGGNVSGVQAGELLLQLAQGGLVGRRERRAAVLAVVAL